MMLDLMVHARSCRYKWAEGERPSQGAGDVWGQGCAHLFILFSLRVLSGRIKTIMTHLRRHQAYLRNPATPDPGGPNRFSIGPTACALECVQHPPAIPELTKVHVFPVELG